MCEENVGIYKFFKCVGQISCCLNIKCRNANYLINTWSLITIQILEPRINKGILCLPRFLYDDISFFRVRSNFWFAAWLYKNVFTF
jgi:hypothetical protein